MGSSSYRFSITDLRAGTNDMDKKPLHEFDSYTLGSGSRQACHDITANQIKSHDFMDFTILIRWSMIFSVLFTEPQDVQ